MLEPEAEKWTECASTIVRPVYIVKKLRLNKEYIFRVAAENKQGVSVWAKTDCITVKYPFRKPRPPEDVTVKNMTLESAYLEWNRPTMDGGSEILGYYVEYKDRNSLNWRAANRGVSRERKMKVSGLQAGLVYLFRVCTENIVGKSKWSKETDGDVARDQCSPPLNVKPVAADRTSATIEWDLPEYDGGSHISGYMVERRELPDGRWLKCNYCNITDRTYQITSLTEEMNYEF